MQSTAIESIGQLQDYLNKLPAVKEGCVRLFRGQTRNFPTISPTACRIDKINGRNLWDIYCSLIARFLAQKELQRNSAEEKLEDIDLFFFWVNALSQHYGPGTEYLDVTHSLKVALWFAFYEMERKTIYGYAGKQGPVTADDVLTVDDCSLYKKSPTNGWLYVFDVPASQDVLGSSHTVIDILKLAPAVFRRSARLSAQSACLIKCDKKINNGDCSNLLVADPIEIVNGAVDLLIDAMDTSTLFPSPDYDEWYKRFLQVPYSYIGYSNDGHLAVKKNIPVEIYYDDFTQLTPYVTSIRNKLLVQTPLLVYTFCLSNTPPGAEKLEDAIPIMLASPLMFSSPEIETGKWNEAVLWQNASLHPLSQFPEEQSVAGFNFFFEFSPLEVADWEGIDTGGNGDFLRSVWIRSYDNNMIKTMISTQTFPDREISTFDLSIWFDEHEKRLVYHTKNEEGKDSLYDLGIFAKAVYVVLAIIGDWMPGIKLKPFPTFIGDGRNALVHASDKNAAIIPVVDIMGLHKKYYGVFNSETREAYCTVGQVLKEYYFLKLDLDKKFSEFDVTWLYDRLKEQMKNVPG